ncbi:MAG: hypothetical protein Q9168_000885 [Polycauliona sp. 1 TL-2023]
MEDVSETPPKDINPYHTLDLKPTADAAEIRTAYKKLALKHHPDKAGPSQKSTAHSTFQNIAFAYAILSSPHRRTLYDTTGSTSETLSSLSDDDDFNWLSFFRAQYSSLSASALDDFSSSYKESEEERKDLLAAYEKHKGKLNGVYEEVMLSNPLEDEDRFHGIIDNAIEAKEVEAYKAYVKETKSSKDARMKKARREAEHAAHEKKANAKYQSIFGGDGKGAGAVNGFDASAAEGEEKDGNDPEPMTNRQKKAMRGHGDLGNLAAMIQSRNKARGEAFFDNLETKYAGTSASEKGAKRKAEEEPDEEAFQKTKAKMAKGNVEREGKTKQNRKASTNAKVAPKGRKPKATAIEEAVEEDEEDIDLGEESEVEVDGSGPEDELAKDVKPKTKPKPNPKPKQKAQAQKGKATKAAAPTASRNTRSRAKK